MSRNNELIILDQHFSAYAKYIQKYLEYQDIALNDYINSLKTICKEAIISGDVHDQLIELISLAEELKVLSKGQGSEANSAINSFLKRIDEIDLELY